SPAAANGSTAAVRRLHDLREAATEALVRAAATGDQVAWAALVDRFGRLVWSITRTHRLSPEDAADVSQTTWLLLVEHLDRLRRPEMVGAWLASTAARECWRVLRRSKRLVVCA